VVNLIFLDHRVSDHQSLIRLFHPENSQGAELHALGVPEAEMALDRTVFLRVIPRPGRPKMLPAGLHAFLASDARPLVDNPGVGSSLLLHLQGRYRTGFEAGGIGTLVADLGLVVSAQDFLFHDDPRKRRGVAPAAVEIGADDLADPASGAEGFVRQDDPLGKGYLLAVGKSENLQKVPYRNHAPQTESAKSDAFQDRSPVNVFGHLPFTFRL